MFEEKIFEWASLEAGRLTKETGFLEIRGLKVLCSNGHGERWRDSRLTKDVEPTGPDGCGGVMGSQ